MEKQENSIFVTRPCLPPLSELQPFLEEIWRTRWLTNDGPYHRQFETALAQHLGVEHLALFSNGTIALVVALQSLRITGEVITTPFSFVATAHSLLWNGIKPIFVDIDPESLTLDAEKIESEITPQTTAIMPVHVYGRPCNVHRIQEIADIYGLKVIYDAAHAFDIKLNGISLLQHGDLSVLSFHATKVFTTFEGGAIVCPDAKIKKRIDFLKNFGFADEVTVMATGINGKMNEFQAAVGLLQLKYIEDALARRREIDRYYRSLLSDVAGISIVESSVATEHNYAYFPILVESGYPLSRDELYLKLRENSIYARRYFYPLISDFPMYRGLPSAKPDKLPVAQKIASQVLCLPIYPDLSDEQVAKISNLIKYGK